MRAAYGSLGRTCLGVAQRAKTEAPGKPVQTYQNPRMRGWHNRLLHDAITLFFAANGYAARTSAGSYSFYSQPGAYAPGYHISPAQVRVQMFGGRMPAELSTARIAGNLTSLQG